MTALHELTAAGQLAALERREVSSRELVLHYLDRIARLDADLRCFSTVLGDHALAEADAADSARARGEATGLLHGLPLALKDLHAAAGLRTTFGSRVFADLVTPDDAPAIARLRGNGAVVLGRTNVPEFGPTCYTDNDLTGVTVTPYDTSRSASGSSGGSAAAVAAGFVGLAHGSDGLGSIRTPAANCGLVGVKPSRGRVAGSGAGWLALAVEGPLARTVEDAALFLDAMGGPAASDLWRSGGDRGPQAFQLAAQQTVGRRLRIGRVAATSAGHTVHPDCLAALDTTTELLAGAGHTIVDVPPGALPDPGPVGPAVLTVLRTSLARVVDATMAPEQRALLMPFTRWLVESGPVSAAQLLDAQATLAAAAVSYLALFDSYDLLLSPTTSSPPVANADLRLDDGPASFAAMSAWSAFTPAANISGTPAVSLPVAMTGAGLPVAVQLGGPVGSDELLLTVSADLERSVPWYERHPPVWHR